MSERINGPHQRKLRGTANPAVRAKIAASRHTDLAQRNDIIIARASAGEAHEAIAVSYGLSKQRISQIVYGIQNKPEYGSQQPSYRSRAIREPGMPWTVHEMAKALRINAAQAFAIIRLKLVKVVTLGDLVRIPDSEMRRLIGEQEGDSAP
jgi:hypothetical protein